jgi:PAS domain S-box-containing protein
MRPQPPPLEALRSAALDPIGPLRSVADLLPHLIWFQLADGRIAYANRRFLEFFGRGADDLGNLLEFAHIEDRGLWTTSCQPPFNAPREVSLRVLAAKGHYHRLVISLSPAANDAGKLIGLTAMVRMSEEFARGLLNSLPEQIVVLNEQGVVCAVNEAWERFTIDNSGSQQAVTIGVNYLDVCRRSSQAGDECAANVLEQLQAILAGTQEKCVVEYPCHAPNRQRWFLMHAQRFDYGQRGMILSHVDITERKLAEDALRESEARFRLMADGLPLIVWVHDSEGKLEFVNQTLCNYFGVTREEVRDARWKAYTHPDDRVAYTDEFDACVREHRPFHREVRVKRSDGQWRWIESWGRPRFSDEGVYLGHIGTSADITERKRAESLLREQDKRKDEFLATLAHELRNPLAPIRTGLELMKHSMDDPALLAEVRETMERQTTQLVTLVNDLLDVSRITQGKFQLRKSRVLLADIVHSALEACQPLIQEAEHQLVVRLPEKPLLFDADPHRLAQVLSNLLNNAAKYTPAGGHISLTAEVDDAALSITMSDNGIGIPTDMQDRVFEMFAQIDRFNELGSAGLGIGLSLVKSLVEMHGGTVSVASDGPNQGSHFTIRLPISEHSRSLAAPSSHLGLAAPTSPPAAPQKSKLSVLIVDDNVAAAKTLSLVVRLSGHEVRVAHDGREACGVAEDFLPQVIMSDIGMPHMDGYQLAKWIRRQSWGGHTTLIALTGWGQAEDQKRTKEAGFDYHLVKPAEPAEIERILQSAGPPRRSKDA